MSEVWNPADVEAAIREVSNRISKGVKICSDAYEAFQKADHALDLAFARAYMAYSGAAHAKKYAAEIATEEERKARIKADVAYKYADRQAKSLTEELKALQSVGASIREIYKVAGRGES